MLTRALRIWRYDWLKGKNWVLLPILCFCLFALCLLRLVSAALEQTMLQDTHQIVGADWILTSSRAPEPAWLEKAEHMRIRFASTIETSTVLVAGDNSAWVGLKAVDANYPLAGKLVLSLDKPNGRAIEVTHGPDPGEVWIAPRLHYQLGLSIGDTLEVGYASLTVAGFILQEPDRGGFAYALAPRVMIHTQDMAATQLIKAHSRVDHITLFLQSESNRQSQGNWNRFYDWIKPQLTVHDELVTSLDRRQALRTSVDKASQYYQLIGVMGFLLSGAALLLAIDRYLRRQCMQIALLKTLGMRLSNITGIYALHWVLASIITVGLVLLLCNLSLNLMTYFVRHYFEIELANPGLGMVYQSIGLGLVWIWTLGGYRFFQVLKLSPADILQGRMSPISSKKPWLWPTVIVLCTLSLWALFYAESFAITIIGVLAWALVVVGLVFAAGRFLKPNIGRFKFEFRLVLRQWFYLPKLFFLQLVTLSFVIFAYVCVYQFEHDVFSNWQNQIPKDAPNYFILNIFEEHIDPIKQYLTEQNLQVDEFYPIVRGRPIRINDTQLNYDPKVESEQNQYLDRELNLTWTNQLPYKNDILQGAWFNQITQVPNQISMEQEMADALGVKLNDTITFSLLAREISAQVTSIRKVRWDTMTPNFYVIFSPGVLEREHFTYMLALHVPKAQGASTIAKLSTQFPELNVFDTGAFINKVATIKDYVALVLTLASAILMGAVATILIVCIANTWDERLSTYSACRLLGVPAERVSRIIVYEYALIGLICGVIAVGASQALAYWGFTRLLEVDWSPNLTLILLTPIASALTLGIVSSITSQFLTGSSGLFKRT